MTRRGYYGIGVYHPKHEVNVGTLWRSAQGLGATFVFTVGRRYGKRQASDTHKTRDHVPLFHFADMDDLIAHLPHGCPLVGVEHGGLDLARFSHPCRAAYLLGAEDHGLPRAALDRCHARVQIESEFSFNVAVAGSLVAYDRVAKEAA